MKPDFELVVGNAPLEGKDRRGWFIGSFLPKGTLQHNAGVEIKWGTHPKGEQRSSLAVDGEAYSVTILLSGLFKVIFEQQEILLEKEGDYIMWRPNKEHATYALEDSLLLTVRWPSISRD